MNRKGFLLIEVFFVLAITFLIALLLCSGLFQASVEAKIFNQKYGTSYTKWDFMWAGQSIKDYMTYGRNETTNLNFKVS